MELSEFLLARIGEDEAVAREALHPDAVSPGAWVTEHHNSEYHSEPNRAHIAEDRSGHYWSVAHEVFIPIAVHIARHAPARVLAECEAKRRIVDLHRAVPVAPGRRELTCVEDGALTWPCPTLRFLAAPYADHSDYCVEWRA
jgi:hypothetical protein